MTVTTKLDQAKFLEHAKKFGLSQTEIDAFTLHIFEAGMSATCYPAARPPNGAATS